MLNPSWKQSREQGWEIQGPSGGSLPSSTPGNLDWEDPRRLLVSVGRAGCRQAGVP